MWRTESNEKQDVKEDLNQWLITPCSYIGRLSTLSNISSPQILHVFRVVMTKIIARFFKRIWYTGFKFYKDIQGPRPVKKYQKNQESC